MRLRDAGVLRVRPRRDERAPKAPYDPNRPLRLYCTHSPCPTCSKLILNTSIESVGYLHRYRDVSGVALLREHGLSVTEVEFNLDHFTRIHAEITVTPTKEHCYGCEDDHPEGR